MADYKFNKAEDEKVKATAPDVIRVNIDGLPIVMEGLFKRRVKAQMKWVDRLAAAKAGGKSK